MISFARAHKGNVFSLFHHFSIFHGRSGAHSHRLLPHVCISFVCTEYGFIHFYYLTNVKYQGFSQVLPLEHFYGINMQLRIKFIFSNHAATLIFL